MQGGSSRTANHDVIGDSHKILIYDFPTVSVDRANEIISIRSTQFIFNAFI